MTPHTLTLLWVDHLTINGGTKPKAGDGTADAPLQSVAKMTKPDRSSHSEQARQHCNLPHHPNPTWKQIWHCRGTWCRVETLLRVLVRPLQRSRSCRLHSAERWDQNFPAAEPSPLPSEADRPLTQVRRKLRPQGGTGILWLCELHYSFFEDCLLVVVPPFTLALAMMFRGVPKPSPPPPRRGRSENRTFKKS